MSYIFVFVSNELKPYGVHFTHVLVKLFDHVEPRIDGQFWV